VRAEFEVRLVRGAFLSYDNVMARADDTHAQSLQMSNGEKQNMKMRYPSNSK
jgi:hypothetical protein